MVKNNSGKNNSRKNNMVKNSQGKYDLLKENDRYHRNRVKEIDELTHRLALDYLERNAKEFENKKAKWDFLIKASQLIISNVIFIISIVYSVKYANKLIGLIEKEPNAIWILGPFALGVTLAILYICGSTMKAVFGLSDKDKNNHVLSTLETISKVKSTIDTKN